MDTPLPRITIEPAQAQSIDRFYECPACRSFGTFRQADAIPIDEKAISPEMRPAVSLYASLHLFECAPCKRGFYFVELDLVDNPSVSNGWTDQYFFRKGPQKGPQKFFIVNSAALTLPAWRVMQQITPEGTLTRHYFGPFFPSHDPIGSDGAVSWSGHPDWVKAGDLIRLVLPLAVANFPIKP